MTWQGPGAQTPPWDGHQQLPSQDRGSPALKPQFGQLWNVEFCSSESAPSLSTAEIPLPPGLGLLALSAPKPPRKGLGVEEL